MGPPIEIGGNPAAPIAPCWPMPELQWGHRSKSVETASADPQAFAILAASMGPPIEIGGNVTTPGSRAPRSGWLQWGHRSKSVETVMGRVSFGQRIPGFNGATDRNRWKRGQRRRNDAQLRHASMGPPIEIGGNMESARIIFGLSGWGFNGATDRNRWKRSSYRRRSSQRRCFNGATDRNRWKPR